MPTPVSGSFRDPSGRVFRDSAGSIYRDVYSAGIADYRLLVDSGLGPKLIANGDLVSHEELPGTGNSEVILKPETVLSISYPYEWCFSQLKDAALTTLRIQLEALKHGMSLKDATAYNIQFHHGKPLLIDTLSFEAYREGEPWVAYGQFCRHFLAPLALMSHVDVRLITLLRDFIDGIPLDLASRLLPGTSKLNLGLALHIHTHAKSHSKHDGSKLERPAKVTKQALLGILDNLESTTKGLSWKPGGTEWADYYANTNYNDEAMRSKEEGVAKLLDELGGSFSTIWDLGANVGNFSRIAAKVAKQVVSWDIDPSAVEQHYLHIKSGEHSKVLPLLQDFANPSAAIGWLATERDSLFERGPVDVAMGLALIHHLAIGNNVPFDSVAQFFAACGDRAIVEWVPKDDGQTQRLLANRKDIFDQYTEQEFERAFAQQFELVFKLPVEASQRTLYAFRKRP